MEEEVGENLRKVPSSAGEIPVSFWSIKGSSVPDILADVVGRETEKKGEKLKTYLTFVYSFSVNCCLG